MYFFEKFSEHLLVFLCSACEWFLLTKNLYLKTRQFKKKEYEPKTSIVDINFTEFYEKKNATKVYPYSTKPIVSEYEESISALGKVRQKIEYNLSLLEKYQLHQTSISPKFTLNGEW